MKTIIFSNSSGWYRAGLVLLASALVVAWAGVARADAVYVVRPGDSLTRIAAATHTTVRALIALNRSAHPCLALNPSCLQIGWTLIIPEAPLTTLYESQTYLVQVGDSLARIAGRLGTTVQALTDANRDRYPCLATRPACLQVGWLLVVPTIRPTPASNTPSSVAPAGPTPAGDTLETRLAISAAVNGARQTNGVASLAWEGRVAALAQIRSLDMATRGYLSHFDPQTGVLLSAQLMRPAGFNTGCENLYATLGRPASEIPAASVALWLSSASHRACLLNGAFSLLGVGVAQGADGRWYVTLLVTR